MPALIEQHIQPCNKLSIALSQQESIQLLSQLSGWSIDKQTEINQLKKAYKFKTFNAAMVFANKVSELADTADHHPCICIEWGRATVSWWTHTISGLFINDFIMAAKCDNAYEE